MTVYLVAGIAFAVELLLLLGAGRLWEGDSSPWRCAAGAGLGALHGAVCMLTGFLFLGSIFWRIVFAFLTGWIAYGWKPGKILQFCVLLLGVSLLAEATGRDNLPAAALAALGLWLLCQWPSSEGGLIPLELCREGKQLRLTALQDTGNTLRDPITGEQVLVLSPEAAFSLTGLTVQQLRAPLDTLQRQPISGLKLIPYRTVGDSGFLLGLRFPDARVGGRRCSIVAAFAPEGPGRGEAYQALAGGYV